MELLARCLAPRLRLHHQLLARRATRPPDFASTSAHALGQRPVWRAGKRARPLGAVLRQWRPVALAVERDRTEARRVHRATQDRLSRRFASALAPPEVGRVAAATSAIVGRMSFAETAKVWERVFTLDLMEQQKVSAARLIGRSTHAEPRAPCFLLGAGAISRGLREPPRRRQRQQRRRGRRREQ